MIYDHPLLSGANFPLRALRPNVTWGYLHRPKITVRLVLEGAVTSDDDALEPDGGDFRAQPTDQDTSAPKNRPADKKPSALRGPSQRRTSERRDASTRGATYPGAHVVEQSSSSQAQAEPSYMDSRWTGPNAPRRRGRSRFCPRKMNTIADRLGKLGRYISRFANTGEYNRD